MGAIRIIGVDPGYGRIGVGCIEVEGNHYKYLFHDVIETAQDEIFPARLEMIDRKIGEVCEAFKPHEAAIEKLFFVKNVTTAMKVSEARGVIQLAIHRHHILLFEYTPFEIKQSVTGNGHAEKSQVQKTLYLLLKLGTVPKQDDAADALAAAFCHANSRKLLNGIGRLQSLG